MPLDGPHALLASIGRRAGPLLRASFSDRGSVGPFTLDFHGPRTIRWSIIAGNMRMHRLIDHAIYSGDTFVDVGASIGYNTLYASQCVGPAGRVIAIEPAGDNLEVLRRHISVNRIGNVTVHGVAAGKTRARSTLYLRGAVSGVNSLFPDGCFGPVTATADVPVLPLDDLVEGRAHVVKIDVEGAELDVLKGMPRLLETRPALIVEWHPDLQIAAGYGGDDLPHWLLGRGYAVTIAWHTRAELLRASQISDVAARLRSTGRSVELLAE